ncbi:hypothetical protein BJ165DRAFT_1612793 [Panaeolus papilionaceus]|nr:hypothetical protein BJ165DRAFT_1612793 [Panaeolus papilionaceus]
MYTFSVEQFSNFAITSSRLKTVKCTELVDWFETCTFITAVNGEALSTVKEDDYPPPDLSVEAKRLIMVDSLDLPGYLRAASYSLKAISLSWNENDDNVIKLLRDGLRALTSNLLERIKLKAEVKAEGLPLPSTYFLPWIRRAPDGRSPSMLHVDEEDGIGAPAFLRTRLRRLLAVDADTHGGLKCNVTVAAVAAGDYCYHSRAIAPLRV